MLAKVGLRTLLSSFVAVLKHGFIKASVRRPDDKASLLDIWRYIGF